VSFPSAARAALQDSQLRRNLANATSTIRSKRDSVIGELSDWEELRDAGEAIKDTTLAGLDRHLRSLESAVSAAGGQVHWAEDAGEACAIVAAIASRHGVDEALKVKSIATDEIGLNDALAVAGIQAVETDLAELIVQLGGDTPSHILVPAIHKNRAQIRDLLSRALDLPDLSDDPAALTAAARDHLREKFLTMRFAISGANFAVAETGTVSVFESEGNGRMCITLPEVLVTVMGIEKLVPSWRDMEVFLQLLPRSATGERMNPYTSFWTGVRSGDGPREFHLVLLDNGRTDVLADPVGRQALRCIRCSACLNVCPVYSRVGGHAYESVYPGPIGAILTPQLRGLRSARSLPYASSLCGACYEVCPVKIDIPRVLVHLRGRVVDGEEAWRPEKVAMKTLYRVFASRRTFEAAQLAARMGRPLARHGRITRLPWPLSGWSATRDLPAPPAESFRDWWRRERGAEAPADKLDPIAPAARDKLDPIAPAARDPHDPIASAARDTRDPIAPAARPPARTRIAPAGAGARDPMAPRGGDARARMLGRIARALADAPEPAELPRRYRRRAELQTAELQQLFAERATDYGARVRLTPAAELGTAIAELVAARGVKRLGVPADLPAEWRPPGVRLVADEGLSSRDLDELDGALTGCALAIAETGALVLAGGEAEGRRALTLVPDYHVCVVEPGRVVGLVPEAVERLEPAVRLGRPLTILAGPSATSDIELARVEGVHGPRVLDVLIVV
jgi:L-lactate dehydrogenase complex protein LldF